MASNPRPKKPVDLTELNKRASDAGAAACRQSNGPTREGGKLADVDAGTAKS